MCEETKEVNSRVVSMDEVVLQDGLGHAIKMNEDNFLRTVRSGLKGMNKE